MKYKYWDILIRYLILIIVALPNLYLFYFVLTPLTIYPVYFILKVFTDPVLSDITILVNGLPPIEIIGACVAGAAYYFLLILNLSVPKIKFDKRIRMLAVAFGSLLILNILRILLLISLLVFDIALFDITHKVFWYLVSTVFVVGIWFAEVKLFKIKSFPFYTDLKNLYESSNLKR